MNTNLNALNTIGVAVLLVAFAAINIIAYWNHWAPDLGAVYYAGRFFAAGQLDQVFAAPDMFFGKQNAPAWVAMMQADGVQPDQFTFPFVYPPLWAAIVSPLAHATTPLGFFNVMLVLHILLTCGSFLLAHRLAAPSMRPLIFIAGTLLVFRYTLPGQLAMFHNQPQFVVTFLILLAFERYVRGASVIAGIALGLAAAIKISPVLLALIFLMDRDWRAIMATGLTGAATVALSLLLAGPELHLEFIAQIQKISSLVALMHINYTLELALFEIGANLGWIEHTFLRDADGILSSDKALEPGWIGILTKLALIGGLVAVIRSTRRLDFARRTLARLVGIYIVTALAAPLAWSHHFMLIMMLLPGLALFRPMATAIAIGALVVLVMLLPVFAMTTMILADAHLSAFAAIFALSICCYGFIAPHPTPAISRKNAPETAFATSQS